MWNRKQWLALVVLMVVVRWMYALLFVYPSISPNAVEALRSHNYTTVGLALFSSETQKDINALTPAFISMRIRDAIFLPLSIIAPWMWFNYILLTGY